MCVCVCVFRTSGFVRLRNTTHKRIILSKVRWVVTLGLRVMWLILSWIDPSRLVMKVRTVNLGNFFI